MKGVKRILTEQEHNWLVKHFKNTRNSELAERLGISDTTLHRFARELGLTKTAQFRRKMQLEAMKKAYASNIKNGTFPPKGHRIPNSEQYQFKPGHKESARTKAKRKKSLEGMRHKMIMEERMRLILCQPQKTKLKVTHQPVEKIYLRTYLRSLGYKIERGSNTAYYDDQTRRSIAIESRTKADKHYYYFEFLPMI